MTVGMDFTQVSLLGNDVNMEIRCRSCGVPFDPTQGADAVFSTVDGELQRVADLIQDLQANAPATPDDLAERLERTGSNLAPLAAWVRSHQEVWVPSLISVVLWVLTMLMQSPEVSPEQIEELIHQVEQRQREPGPAEDRSGSQDVRRDRPAGGDGRQGGGDGEGGGQQ